MNELTLEQIISLATNTAYYPTEEKWESDYKTRKAVRNNDLFIL